MSSKAKFEGVFVDENILGAAYELERTHPGEVYYVGHPDMPEVPVSTKDPAMLAVLGANDVDLVFLTRDKRIRSNIAERQALVNAKIRAVFISGTKNMEKAQVFALVEKHWDEMVEKVGSESGPVIWSLTHGNGLRKLCL